MDRCCCTTEQFKLGDMIVNSKRLVTALNAIGFSEKTRRTVTDYAVLHDILYNIGSAFNYRVFCRCTMGSRREGTTNYMLNSDRDEIHYNPLLRMFETVQLKTNCRFNTHLITLKDSSTPIGYTKIQLVQNRGIVRSEAEIVGDADNNMFHFDKFKNDQKGRFVLSNEFNPYNDTVFQARNGPADTICHEGRHSIDNVRAYFFDDIPKIMSPWFTRSRPQGWPSKETLELCKRMGCFVVPVGQANSEERNLEWRFSMSFQEQQLMLNLNEAQYKCYIILKLIKKFLIKPKFGDILSSYHFKTCLFYTIENVGTDSWKPQSLLKNLISCLKQMMQWIKDGNCPNFFVPDENMFASKLNKDNQCDIRVYLENLIKTNCIDLIQIGFANFGTLLSTECDLTDTIMNTFLKNEIAFAADAHAALNVICKFGVAYEHANLIEVEHAKLIELTQHIATVNSYEQGNTVLTELFKTTLNSIAFMKFCQGEIENNRNGKTIMPIELAVFYIFYSFCLLEQSIQHPNRLKLNQIHYNHSHEKQLVLKGIQMARSKVFTDMANLHVANYVQTKNSSGSIDLNSLNYFDKGKAVNYLTNRLKYARLFCIQHMYGKCHSLLNKLAMVEKKTIHTCICYSDNSNAHQLSDSKICRVEQETDLASIWNEHNAENRANMRAQLIANNFTNCVIYENYELGAINAPLFYEAFRSFETATHTNLFSADYWFSRAVFDPVVYLHFMLIECNDQLNDRGGSASSLELLENMLFVNCDNSLWHLETAMNLVGHVYVKKGWEKLARECYRKSLNVRPLHNAAKWHIMFLLFG